MVVRRVLATTGGLMVAAGVVLLLFVAFQLWGTGVQTRAAQGELRQTFDAQLEQVDQLPPTDAEREAAAAATLASLEVGGAVGRLEIPAIGVHYIVLEGVDEGRVAVACTRARHSTPMPVSRQSGSISRSSSR